jgi:hypothetical protein
MLIVSKFFLIYVLADEITPFSINSFAFSRNLTSIVFLSNSSSKRGAPIILLKEVLIEDFP